MTADDPAAFLRRLFDAAVAAADPLVVVPEHLPERPEGRVVVVGAGKASARMAQAVEAAWGACEGIVVVPHGTALPLEGIEIVEARHPVPDAAGEAAARRIMALAEGLAEGDTLLCLISGGGSSLLPLAAEGLTLDDKMRVHRALLKSGATIGEMNVVRKHLSAIKGGRLAFAAHPARVVTLLVSDVPGDDPGTIASGPTVAATSTPADARAILERYGIDAGPGVTACLDGPAAATPDPAHPVFAEGRTRIVARPMDALMAARDAARAERADLNTVILGDAIEGEARETAIVLAGIARSVLDHGHPVARPALLLSGGETTVTVRGPAGRGGRNSEFLLSFGLVAPEGAWAIACDTDGIDGSEDNAGALWSPDLAHPGTVASIRSHLDNHDAFSFFREAGALVETGPTHTNVNDFRAIYLP